MSSKIVDPEVQEEPVEEQVNETLEALAVEEEVEHLNSETILNLSKAMNG